MFIGFLGIGLSAFWIGWNLDMGLATSPAAPLPNLNSIQSASTSMGQGIDVGDNPGSEIPSPSPSLSTSSEPIPGHRRELEPSASLPQPKIARSIAKSSTNSLVLKESPQKTSQLPDQGTPAASPPAKVAESPPEIVTAPFLEQTPRSSTEMKFEPETTAEVIPAVDLQAQRTHEPRPILETNSEKQPTERVQPSTVSINGEPVMGDEISSRENAPASSHSILSKLTSPSTDVSEPKHRPKKISLQEPNTENVLKHAQGLIQTGQYQEAVKVLSPLFLEPPHHWEPWFWMGTAYLGQGDLKQADQFFLSGLARNDKIPQLWVQRALVAQQVGNFQLALQELRQAESLQPNLPHLHLNMGYAYDRLGNERLAIQYYGKFLQVTEGNPVFFSTREKLLARLTRTQGAAHSLFKSAGSGGEHVP